MNAWMKKTATLLAGGACLAGSFYAGVAYAAADPKLDDADANVEKAIALLKASENPGVKPPFGGHRAKAVWHGKMMRRQIAKAKAYAENPKPKKGKKKAKKKGKKKGD